MKPPPLPLDPLVSRALAHLVPPDRQRALLGHDGDGNDQSTPDAPVADRVRETLRAIEQGLRVVADQAEELGDDDYRTQARGEVMAGLICLRELWSRFPEVWGDGGSAPR